MGLGALGLKISKLPKKASDRLSRAADEESENLDVDKALWVMLYTSVGRCGPIYLSVVSILCRSGSASLYYCDLEEPLCDFGLIHRIYCLFGMDTGIVHRLTQGR